VYLVDAGNDTSTTLFLTTAGNLNLSQEVRGNAISFLRKAYPRKFPGFKMIPTTETEIKSIIVSLKAKALKVMME
jgi:hypothetical protein